MQKHDICCLTCSFKGSLCNFTELINTGNLIPVNVRGGVCIQNNPQAIREIIYPYLSILNVRLEFKVQIYILCVLFIVLCSLCCVHVQI